MFGAATGADLLVKIGADVTNFLNGMAKVEGRTAGFGSRMSSIGRGMMGAGRSMTMGITVPALGAAAGAIKLANDWDKSMDQIVGLVGIGKEEVASWEDDILKMGTSLGKSPRELADAMFFITSAGLRGNTALEALEMSATASAAGLGETKVVADALTSAMNAYGAENLSAAEATDVLTATVRTGKLEASSLAGAVSKVIPMSSQLGIEFHEVGAALAVMSKTGTSAAQGSTALRSMMTSLVKPSKEARTAFEEAGYSMDEFRDVVAKKGLLTGLKTLKSEVGGNVETWAKLFPNVRALSGILSITGKGLKENSAIFKDLENNVDETKNAYKAGTGDMGHALDQLKASVEAAGITLGTALGPAVSFVADKLKGLTDFLTNMDPKMRTVVVTVAAVVAAIGPLLIVFGMMATGLGSIISLFGTLSGVFGGAAASGAAASGGVGAVGAAAGTVLAPILAVIGIVAGLVAGFVILWNKSASFRNFWIGMWQKVQAFVAQMMPKVKQVIADGMTMIQAIIKRVTGIVTAIWRNHGQTIMNVVKIIWEVVKNVVRSGLMIIQGIIKVVTGIMKGDWSMVWNGIKMILDAAWDLMISLLKNALKLAATAVGAGLQLIVNFFRNLPGWILSAIDGLGDMLWQAGSDMIRGLIGGIKSMAGEAVQAVKDVVSAPVKAAKDLLGIGSPSKVFMGIGYETIRGLNIGLSKNPVTVPMIPAPAMPRHTAMKVRALVNTELSNGIVRRESSDTPEDERETKVVKLEPHFHTRGKADKRFAKEAMDETSWLARTEPFSGG